MLVRAYLPIRVCRRVRNDNGCQSSSHTTGLCEGRDDLPADELPWQHTSLDLGADIAKLERTCHACMLQPGSGHSRLSDGRRLAQYDKRLLVRTTHLKVAVTC